MHACDVSAPDGDNAFLFDTSLAPALEPRVCVCDPTAAKTLGFCSIQQSGSKGSARPGKPNPIGEIHAEPARLAETTDALVAE